MDLLGVKSYTTGMDMETAKGECLSPFATGVARLCLCLSLPLFQCLFLSLLGSIWLWFADCTVVFIGFGAVCGVMLH